MQSMKEAAASAKAGMEKAKASMQEKVDKMKTRDPAEKQMVRDRKEVRKEEAQKRKQEAREQNATAMQTGFAAGGGFDRGDVNRGYTTTSAGTGYDAIASRRVGDIAATQGQGYSAIGSQDYESRNWEDREPNNATRRNVGENDPYYGTNE
ncbi:hypothetical protein V6N13_048888 [Hibiscus sabdariffa]|uniref:Uncharacterized protein n=1 Tax=Hibiscus sabdariffa TaxID=183260 RepID=A0ABR2QYY2_9ROSI